MSISTLRLGSNFLKAEDTYKQAKGAYKTGNYQNCINFIVLQQDDFSKEIQTKINALLSTKKPGTEATRELAGNFLEILKPRKDKKEKNTLPEQPKTIEKEVQLTVPKVEKSPAPKVSKESEMSPVEQFSLPSGSVSFQELINWSRQQRELLNKELDEQELNLQKLRKVYERKDSSYPAICEAPQNETREMMLARLEKLSSDTTSEAKEKIKKFREKAGQILHTVHNTDISSSSTPSLLPPSNVSSTISEFDKLLALTSQITISSPSSVIKENSELIEIDQTEELYRTFTDKTIPLKDKIGSISKVVDNLPKFTPQQLTKICAIFIMLKGEDILRDQLANLSEESYAVVSSTLSVLKKLAGFEPYTVYSNLIGPPTHSSTRDVYELLKITFENKDKEKSIELIKDQKTFDWRKMLCLLYDHPDKVNIDAVFEASSLTISEELFASIREEIEEAEAYLEEGVNDTALDALDLLYTRLQSKLELHEMDHSEHKSKEDTISP